MSEKKIYMIGICGVAMGSLAAMFSEKGHHVSGSDQNVYPPMSDALRRSGITLYEGFNADNIGSPDLVIVGNAVSRGNPEVEYVLNKRIPYLSMAEALRNYFLSGKEVIAVCGTHGKSTTSALLAHILESAGQSPSFFVGGVVRNYESNYKIGSGRYFVIEGDEYDSSFFEKIPKFILYRPDHLLLTSLEFDHADIFNGLDEIELWFKRLVNIIPSNGNVVYSSDYANLAEIASASRSKRYSFGVRDSDFLHLFKGFAGDFAELAFKAPRCAFGLKSRLFGRFNYANIAAAASMAVLLGTGIERIQRGVETFTGVRRRQELIYENGTVKIYEDFAHHPTAVKCTLEAVRERHPGARLWAVYEPRSATSRRNVFQSVLPSSFASADEIIIKSPYEGSAISADRKLDVRRLLDDIRVFNGNVRVLDRADDIVQYISKSIDIKNMSVIVLMSNGGFDGIYEKLAHALDSVAGAGQASSDVRRRTKKIAIGS
jgi:UDP-N-acetylmuramate: L-alanyl-gamma-D-glutamyl-meso-diaminopimelate ligase